MLNYYRKKFSNPLSVHLNVHKAKKYSNYAV